MIKESDNLNIKTFQMLPSTDDYFYAKNLRCQLILTRDMDDQRITQSDWR